jgi:exodeoxyribonuclease VII large subunit
VPIEIFPVRVQGEGAAEEISQALKTINSREDSGVIVLCRGGGSLEDLWAFNEEKTAWAIYDSHLPVVAAIGHEVDFTIADFVADHRSPTPTAAARDVLPDRETLRQQLARQTAQLQAAMKRKIETLRQKVRFEEQHLGDPTSLLQHFRLVLDNSQLTMSQAMQNGLHRQRAQLSRLENLLARYNPEQKVAQRRQLLGELEEKLILFSRLYLEKKRKQFEKAAVLLDAVSPLAVLSRGYSIVYRENDGVVLRASSQVNTGDMLRIRLQEGILRTQVIARKP